MRIIFTLLLLTFSISISAQPGCDALPFEKGLTGKVTGLNITNTSGIKTVFTCQASLKDHGAKPLLVIDGEIIEIGKIGELNPNLISNVTILKESAATCIFGCGGNNGAILVTTNSIQLIIKDKITDEALFGASIFMPGTTIGIAANKNGIADMKDFAQYMGQEFSVSYLGYKPGNIILNGGTQTIYLDRAIEVGPEAIVTCTFSQRKGCCCCGGCFIRENELKQKVEPKTIKPTSFKVFPSPAQRGQTITVEIQSADPVEGYLKFISLDGKTMVEERIQLNKGANRLEINTDPRWSAGIYFMQFSDKLHHKVEQQKILIQ